jgi:hypothetical protein
MKKYNPYLYEERFGDYSEWAKNYGADDKVENLINSKKTSIKDEEFGYYGGSDQKDTRSKRSGSRSDQKRSERKSQR